MIRVSLTTQGGMRFDVGEDGPMEAILQLVVTLSAGLFAGAATYVTFVEHPARMQCGARLAVAIRPKL